MTSPYSMQQMEIIHEMQRQQKLLQYQMFMEGQMHAQANSMHSHGMFSGPMMIPQQATNSPGYGSPPIVVVESDDEDDDEEQRTLFVANIDERVTEELLYEVFLQSGPIEKVRIPKDNNGRQRTFGFVTFKHRCSPPYAMNLLQGLSLYRKTLTIKFNGKAFPPPLKSPILGLGTNNEKHIDNSALRGGNYSAYMDNTPSSSRHQDRHSKHGSNQSRPHSNVNPFNQQPQHRRDSPNHYNDKRRYHNNNKSSGNNGNNSRYSDHRSSSGGGAKYRI